jgi:hypothetical protein
MWLGLCLLAAQAEVLQVQGAVEYRSPEKSKKWSKLAPDMTLHLGDQIQTGLKSRCLLQVGEATRVLIRSSTFATLSQAFIEKNQVRAEIRLDVGSVHVEVEELRVEEVDLRVSTPIGTASIRGSGMYVETGEQGTNVEQTRGTILSRRSLGPPHALTAERRHHRHHVPFNAHGYFGFLQMAAAILSRADGGPTGEDHSFRGTLDFVQAAQDLGPDIRCGPRSNGSDFSVFKCSPFLFWPMLFDPAQNKFDVRAGTKLTDVRPTVAVEGFIGSVRNTDLFRMGLIGNTWFLQNLLNGRNFSWDPNAGRWVLQ